MAADIETLAPLIAQLESHLVQHSSVLFDAQHRDAKNMKDFNVKGSWALGVGSNSHFNLGRVGQAGQPFIKHPYRNTAVWLKPVDEQVKKLRVDERQPRAKAYELAEQILRIADPDMAAHAHITQFALIDSEDHYVSAPDAVSRPKL